MQTQPPPQQELQNEQVKHKSLRISFGKRWTYPSLQMSPLRRQALDSCITTWLIALTLIINGAWIVPTIFFDPTLVTIWRRWIRLWLLRPLPLPHPNPFPLFFLVIGLIIITFIYISYTISLTINAIAEWRDWKEFSHFRAVYTHRYNAAAGLKYYLAGQFWNQQRLTRGRARPAFIEEPESSATNTRSDKAVNQISYASLANLPFPLPPLPFMYNNLPETLDIPEQPEEVSPALLGDDPLPPLPKEVYTYEEKRTLSLFGELVIQIGGQACSPIVIKDPVQQELLAFITSESRYKDLKREDILNEIYEARYPNDNTDQLRDKLYKDAFVLRKSFKEASLQARLPYINPFPVSRGSNAIWQLDSAYTVLDLAYLTQVRTQWEAIKKGGLEDIGRFRNIWDEAKRLYIKGFLTRLVQIGAIGKWAKNRYRQYREEYRTLTLEIADYEKTLGERLSGEEQRLCFRHSAQMYKDYAFATMPLKKEELERGGQTHLSEHALQYCIIMFTQSGDKESVNRTYYEYRETMKRRFPAWEEEPQTTNTWQNAPGE